MRIAASVGYLGLAARLISPAVGMVAGFGVLPELTWSNLHWRRGPGTELRLACAPVQAARVATPSGAVGPAGLLALLRMAILPVLDLGVDVVDRYRVSPQTIRGNVASAVYGAATVVASSAAAVDDPGVAERAWLVATDLLAQPELVKAGSVVDGGGRPGAFRRRSCCLMYRVGGAELCGDCVLGTIRGEYRSDPIQQDHACRNGQ